jgi:hypothetical protein
MNCFLVILAWHAVIEIIKMNIYFVSKDNMFLIKKKNYNTVFYTFVSHDLKFLQIDCNVNASSYL